MSDKVYDVGSEFPADFPAKRKEWLDAFLVRLDALFGARLEFFGLQGSYGRGEQTDGSDIDLVIVLDRVDFADLTAYRKLLDETEDGALVCGFVAGADELSAWDAADLVQLCLDTVPIRGSLEKWAARLGEADIRRAVLTGACALYHACAHNYLHERSTEMLSALIKTARFVVRLKNRAETGTYTPAMRALRRRADETDGAILDAAVRGSGDAADFDALSAALFGWAQAVIDRFGRP